MGRIALLVFALPATADAFPAHLRRVEALYGIGAQTNADCGLCHTAGGGSPRNAFGHAFQVEGANDAALRAIEDADADRDGISNLGEILAGTFPGDPSSTPTENGAEEAIAAFRERTRAGEADDLPPVDASAGEFALDVPDEALGEGITSSGAAPSLTYTIGGAIDMRVAIATQDRGNPVRTVEPFVHVAEIVLQTTIGQRVTLLGEVLLPMNADQPLLEQFLGNDHGFYYVTIRDVPYPTASLWAGRYRIPYGVDAVLDGASNPLPTPVYRSLGRISDLAIMVKGWASVLEYSVAVTDGIGVLPAPEGSTEEDQLVEDWPVFGRVAVDLADAVPGLHAGVSGYYGRSFREPPIGHAAHMPGVGVLALKWRGALATWWVAGRFGVHVEGEMGQDELEGDALADYRAQTSRPDFDAFETLSVFGRVSYRLFDPFDVAAQAHYFDPNRNRENADDGSERELGVGAAATYRFLEQVRGRLAWLGWFLDDADRVDLATVQLLVEF